jgi:ribosomal protein S18 acetylase RimI-like enzyme
MRITTIVWCGTVTADSRGRRPLRVIPIARSSGYFGLFDPDGDLVACAVVVELSPTDAKIRQMAVSPIHQRRGLGKRMMTELEANLRSRGFTNLFLHARASAVGFYEKLGYATVGGEFLEVSVAHFRMIKVVEPSRPHGSSRLPGGGSKTTR